MLGTSLEGRLAIRAKMSYRCQGFQHNLEFRDLLFMDSSLAKSIVYTKVFIADDVNKSIFRCLSALYRDPDWSQKDLKDAIRRAQDTVSSSKAGAFSPERLKYYFQELNAMEITGRKASFTDLWGLIVEYFLQQEVKEFMFGCVLLFVFLVGTLLTHIS